MHGHPQSEGGTPPPARDDHDGGRDSDGEGGRDSDPQAPGTGGQAPRQAPGGPDPLGGVDREVGDLEDPDAEDDGALPGRVGGGLAGG